MAKTTKTTKTAPAKPRAVLVANDRYGLYIGTTTDSDASIASTRSVRVAQCRHVAHWQGKTGGITSLAAHGPCGPRMQESRVGAPSPSSLLTGVVNVFDLTPEAVAAFAEIVPR